MMLSEAIDAATQIVGRYPNGGANAGDSYIGALAAMLGSYPRQVALSCADKVHGVVRDCKFLPTPADIVAWCERAAAPLYKQAESEIQAEKQLAERYEFEEQEITGRAMRKSIAELKIKFGDWNDNWRQPGSRERQAREIARAALIGQIGEAAFNALPTAAE